MISSVSAGRDSLRFAPGITQTSRHSFHQPVVRKSKKKRPKRLLFVWRTDQNCSFSDTCTARGPPILNTEFRPNAPPPTSLLATDVVEMPNSPEPIKEIGFAKLGWFKALNKSARKVRLVLSVTPKVRRTDRSVCPRLKPRKAFRPRLPWTGEKETTSAGD